MKGQVAHYIVVAADCSCIAAQELGLGDHKLGQEGKLGIGSEVE